MPTDTRDKLVESAVRRFYREGFRNVGLDQILDDVGISKTAFYKHFECKEDLMLEALESQHRWLMNTFKEMIKQRGGGRPIDQLHALFDVVDIIINDGDFHGCIFVGAAMEFPLPHDPAHEAAARNKQAIETIVSDIARLAGAGQPEAMAQELCMIIEGAYVTRHVTGNQATIAIARRLAQRVIAGHLGTGN